MVDWFVCLTVTIVTTNKATGLEKSIGVTGVHKRHFIVELPGSDPGGGGSRGSESPPPHTHTLLGGPPNFIKRRKTPVSAPGLQSQSFFRNQEKRRDLSWHGGAAEGLWTDQ